MTTRTIAVVSAGLSQPSSTGMLADQLADATSAGLAALGAETEVVSIDLRQHAHDLTDNLLTFFASDALQEAKDAVVNADGLIAVTPIFSASYNGLFKTFFDVLEQGSLRAKPVLLGATGGTARHSLAIDHALRPLFSYLGALVNPTAVFAATEDWGNGNSGGSGLASRIERAGTEFADLLTGRPAPVTSDLAPAANFTEMLRNS